jgi:predicted HicB family RNase H-like nuclease
VRKTLQAIGQAPNHKPRGLKQGHRGQPPIEVSRAAPTDHYTYRVSWSDEDQEFVATCAEFPSLSHLAAGQIEAIEGLRALIIDVVADMQSSGETPPEPLADRRFSGEFVTRVPGELHRLLAIEAAEAGVSLNRLVSCKLAMPLRSPAPLRRATRSRPRTSTS